MSTSGGVRGRAPQGALLLDMDGVDVTSNAVTVGDPSVNYAATVLSFGTPLTNMSYHVYQGVYSDSKTATGGLRTWVNPFVYGTWAAKSLPDNDFTGAQAWIDSCEARGVNSIIMNMGSSGLSDYLATTAGRNYANAHGYGYVKDSNAWGINPQMWFVDDEPDIEEGAIPCSTGMRVPCGGAYYTGILGMKLLETGESLRGYNSSVPTTINIDGNFKPDGWYAYGQLADVLMVDSYYEQEQAGNHWYHPERDPLYEKPTSVYAAAIAATTAAEPNPFHMILYSCKYKDLSLGYIWPYASPQSKQIQAFYALAGGAKGMAYWWYKSGWPFYGLDSTDANAVALWKQIGIIGNIVKTVQPQLVTSHPVSATIQPSDDVWARALAVGTDTMMLIAVTDDFYNDENGYHGTPVTNASVTVTLPSWLLSSPTAFEVAASGISSVSTSLNGDELTVSLGTLDVTRMILITVDPQLMMTIRQRYDTDVRPGLCSFASSECNQNTSAPSFVWHPSAQAVVSGGTANFGIAANGGGALTYQWQKNSVNLTNGGHYAGCTTPFLAVSSVDTNDVANYRCIVTNAYGSATSNQAALSIITVNITQHPSLQNVCPGTNATFSVTATGQGTLYYQWQKNSTDITNGGHYSGCTTAALTVSGVDAGDAANYRCKVTDSTSTAYSNAAVLSVKAATSITAQPSSQSLEAGGMATFTVTATGYGALTYQWQKNEANLSNGGHYSGCTTSTLTVSSVDTNDQANYRCVVSGGCGNATSNEAVLSIDPCAPYVILLNGDFDGSTDSWSVAPNWTGYSSGTSVFSRNTSIYRSSPNAQRVQPPTSGTGAYGGIYQNVFASTGDAVTLVAWSYNESPSTYITSGMGVQFDGSTSRPGSWQTNSNKQAWTSMTVAGKATTMNGVTVFLEATRGSSGTYYADFDDVSAYRANVPPAPAVSNAGTTSLQFDVDPGCNSTNTGAQYAVTIGGGAYTLGTHYVQANGTVGTTVVWQTDATWATRTVTGLVTGTTYTLKTKARYSSTYAQETDLGTGATGAPQSTVTITQQPTAQNTCPGSNASFTVAATGQGNLTYQWQKAQANITNGGHYSGCTTTTLTITGADGSDAADYRCVVTDAGDSLNSNEAALTLKAATTITGQPDARNVCTGANAAFTVTATGDGTLTYQWQKNSVNVTIGGHYSGCTTATLTVTGADSGDVANYRCVVTGGCGSTNSNQAALTLKAATTITTHPSNQTLSSGQTASFSVGATGDGTLTYQWQKDTLNLSDCDGISGATTNSLQIANVQSGDEGSYRCVVTGGCDSVNSNAATLTVYTCPSGLLNGDFEDWPSGNIAPNWTGAYSGTVASQFVRETSFVHGGAYAQKTKSPTTAGAWTHVYQPIETQVGDALTITGYLYSQSGLRPQPKDS